MPVMGLLNIYWLRNEPEGRSARLPKPFIFGYESTSVSDSGAQYFSKIFGPLSGYMSL